MLNNDRIVTVTEPYLPPLEEFVSYLEDIWSKKWITNNGFYHQKLEEVLCQFLKVPYISLFTNGTLPLLVALQVLNITGEVITTPYSFVATTHALWWNNIKPVFVDVDEKTGNLDPYKIEDAITSRTTAIMPVHVYGTPCDMAKIGEIADKFNLKIIYDAAHAFGVEKYGKSILTAGNISTLSFHATKTYNTIEGGALICHDIEMKQKVDKLKNFGFNSETEVTMVGINGKMDEIRAAYGILNLKYIDVVIEKRKSSTLQYRQGLCDIQGIRYMEDISGVKQNYSYFPIFIDKRTYGMSRDELYEKLKKYNIFGRRYFYPLISNFLPYRNLDTAVPDKLPIATKLSNNVICLPMHHGLDKETTEKIIEIIRK
jgi:dTDP-4-amino-4,6-dideoxygalactose transaminase